MFPGRLKHTDSMGSATFAIPGAPLEDESLADITVAIPGGARLRAHRAILAASSDELKAQLLPKAVWVSPGASSRPVLDAFGKDIS